MSIARIPHNGSASREAVSNTARKLRLEGGTRLVGVLAFIAVVLAVAVGFPMLTLAADSITINLGGTEFLPGQRLSFNGFSLNRTTTIDVFMGIVFPGNGPIAFFDPSARALVVSGLDTPALIPKLATFPGNPFVGFPGIYFPTVGLEAGIYQLRFFLASVVGGALQDNRLDPADLLAVDVRPITFLYSSEPRFEFETSVSSAERALVGRSVQETRDFLRVLGAPELAAFTFFVADTLAGLGQAYAKWLHLSPQEAIQRKAHIVGEAGLGFVFLRTPLNDGQVIYHELFHVLQNRLLQRPIFQGDFVPVGGPSWLIEGTATYFSGLTASHYGLFSFASLRQFRFQVARGTSAPLAALETYAAMQTVGTNAAYSLGFAAVDFLLTSGAVSPLFEFWRRIGEGVSWPEAFEQIFGRSIDVFYQQFEAYRRSVLAPQ